MHGTLVVVVVELVELELVLVEVELVELVLVELARPGGPEWQWFVSP
ncbi:MAG TPA: hypothetical protein VN636_10670 [Acidimicrobiia bacterium]|nr:hypothetical protein [Acidimicrobiia bacterium]